MEELKDPPKWALDFLRLYCGDRRLEEIEGDLFELYNDFISEKGPRFATLFYWWLVIRTFRSYAFKNSKMNNQGLSTFLMFFRHNLKVSWRDLRKNKTTSLINVLGLSIGLASFILIYRLVTFELSFNKHLPDRDRIFRVYTKFVGLGDGSFTNYGVPYALPGYAAEHLKGVEVLSHFFTFDTEVKIPNGNGSFKEFKDNSAVLLGDSTYFQLVDQYEWLSGSRDFSLRDPFQVVLTEKQARAYFPDHELHEIIGESIVYQDSLETIVSGIVRQTTQTTDFDFSEMISYATIDASWLKEKYGNTDLWTSTSSHTQLWVKLMNSVDRHHLDEQLTFVSDSLKQLSKDDIWKREYLSQSVNDLHFEPQVGIFDHSGGVTHHSTLKTLSVVAALLLLIAIFNFINLETAQANTKLKEVGIRKVIGSTRTLLLARFICNALIITFGSVVLSVPLAHYGIGAFSDFIPKNLTLGLGGIDFWLFLTGIGLAVGLTAGLYPALLIASPKVSTALKQGFNSRGKGNRTYLRKGLIVCQFIFSQFLIMSTIVVVTQISFMLDKDLGFDQEGVVYIQIPWHASQEKLPILKNQLEQLPEVHKASIHSAPPSFHGWSTRTLSHFKDSVESKHRSHQRNGDSDYFAVYGIEILAGRTVLPREEGSEIMINERFRRDLGYDSNEEALGARLGNELVVVGVISDFHTQSLHFDVEPTLYEYTESGYYLGLKINMQQDLSQTIARISTVTDEVFPDHPAELHFFDETIKRLYETEQKTSKLASLATGIAIFISCLGLFGLISFTTVQRTKEIGIRKVLGATMLQIGNVISKEFLLLILVALAISIPLAYYYTHEWLNNFSFRIEGIWWVYVLGGLISVLVAFLSVGLKIWRASAANPVESLRYE